MKKIGILLFVLMFVQIFDRTIYKDNVLITIDIRED